MSNPLEQYYSRFVNRLITVRFYQIGYTFTFLLGFVGNTTSLLTFSRPTLRKVSTGSLFIMLAVSDTLYLLMCIFDYLEFGFKVPFYPNIAYNEFCRFRYFVMYVAQVASAWILVIVSVDRWIRTQFPFKSNAICTPRNALIAVGVLLFIDVGLHSHILSPLFGMSIPGFANGACGPNFFTERPYYLFYYIQWSFIQSFTNCIGPVAFMLLTLIGIMVKIYWSKRFLVQPAPGNANNVRQKHLQKQMFILMFASICIFCVTNLPLTISKITASRVENIEADGVNVATAWSIFGWVQSLNYAINFYIHCLTSTLFRNEFKQLMRDLFHRNRTPVITIVPPKSYTHGATGNSLLKQ